MTVQTVVKEGGTVLVNNTVTHTIESSIKFAETVVDSATNTPFLIAIDVSALKHFTMVSDYAVTVYTNEASTGSPQESFTLAAGVPVVWNSGDTAIFAGDVDSIFVTNASGDDATLTIIVGTDVP